MAIPIADPFPDVASHVIESIGVWGKLTYWGDSCESIQGAVSAVDWETTLVDVGLVFAIDLKFTAPGVELAGFSAPSGEFPFGFGWKPFSSPFRVSLGVLVGDMGHWMILFVIEVAFRACWMAPIGTWDIAPPLEIVIEFHRALSGFENGRTCD